MEQQRGEVDAKDGALVKEHMERLRSEAEKDTLTSDVVAMRQELATTQGALAARKAEVTRLAEQLAGAQQVCVSWPSALGKGAGGESGIREAT